MSFELLTFPCGEILKLAIHIHRPKTRLLCDAFIVYMGLYEKRKKKIVLGRAYQPPQRRPMDLACHHLETI